MSCCLLLEPPCRQAMRQKIDLGLLLAAGASLPAGYETEDRLVRCGETACGFGGGRCALPPEPPLPLFFFYTVMRTAAEDAVAVVILAVAGKLARREY